MPKCKDCGDKVIWIPTRAGKMMPCDPGLVPYWEGKRDRIVTPAGTVKSCSLVGPIGEELAKGYIPHWATCKK